MLNTLSEQALLEKLTNLVQSEKKMTAEIIEYISEVDRRRLYLKLGFTSLFQYLTESQGYTPGSAQRRIDSARLLAELPELKVEIEEGQINLMQISAMARSVREVKKTGRRVSATQKRDILNAIKQQDLPKSEQTIAEMLSITPKIQEKKSVQRDESVRLEMTFTKEQMALLEDVKHIISNKYPNPTWTEVIEHIARKFTRKPTAKLAVKLGHTPGFVPAIIRRELMDKQQGCQWVDPTTKRRCRSKFQLQLDHVVSKWRGGTSDPANLQILCAVHNRMKFQLECGPKWAGPQEGPPPGL
jgi:hypothetical protein